MILDQLMFERTSTRPLKPLKNQIFNEKEMRIDRTWVHSIIGRREPDQR
jgi:hypothetical protein